MTKLFFHPPGTFSESCTSSILIDCLREFNELYQWHNQLSEIIQKGPLTEYTSFGFESGHRWPLADLMRLQQELTATMARLNREMDHLEELGPWLKIQMLRRHTTIVTYWKDKVRCALGLTLAFAA